ncbi:MAG: hypothetical protein AB1Z22_08155 [Synechococcaceae cyanobacterium]
MRQVVFRCLAERPGRLEAQAETLPTAPTPGPEPLKLPSGVHQLCSCDRSHPGWYWDGRQDEPVRNAWWGLC